MVFCHHYLGLPWGWSGVDLFFVLSGFLITGILFDTRDDQHRVRNFYLRRTLRIFPLYYGIMLVILVSWPLLHWQVNWHWWVWPAYVGNYARFLHPYLPDGPFQRLVDFQPVTLIAGKHVPIFLGHFWSLCVEEQFYFSGRGLCSGSVTGASLQQFVQLRFLYVWRCGSRDSICCRNGCWTRRFSTG